MRGLLLPLVALFCFGSVVRAAFVPISVPVLPKSAAQIKTARAAPQAASQRLTPDQYPRLKITPQTRLHLTEDSLITLDGRSCRYDQIPANAIITFIELANDELTILQIHFRRR